VLALASMVVAGCYLSTLMLQINGSDSAYVVDSGEFQVALPLWGTVHHTGYPLYMLLGSAFVTALGWLGIPASAGAALFSLVWGIGCVALIGALLFRLTGQPLVSASVALATGLTFSMWIHGAIPEVYSMGLFFTLLVLWLVLDLDVCWSDSRGRLLALVCGMGVAHHRLYSLLLPLIALWLWPRVPRGRQPWRRVGLGVGAFALGFLPYVDMVVRARDGGWMYGDPGTWDGFWWLFLGKETGDLQQPLTALSDLLASLRLAARVLYHELSPFGLLLVGLAAPLGLHHTSRRPALLFLVIGGASFAFSVVFSRAVLIEAVLLPTTLSLFLVAGLGLGNACQRAPGLKYPVVAALLALVVYYFAANHKRILEITRDPAGMDAIAQLADLNAPAPATIMSPWGRRNFALAYATRVELRFPGWRVMHHSENWREIMRRESVVYTNSDSIYGFGPEWWQETLGAEPYFSAAGPGWVAIGLKSLPMVGEHPVNIDVMPGIHLSGWTFAEQDGAFQVTLCWQALRSLGADYSTFVHLGSVAEIVMPEQLVASSDHSTPVDGWRPTSGWRREEVVCDAHAISLPPEAGFSNVIAGMYTRTDSSGFEQLGALRWARELSEWVMVR